MSSPAFYTIHIAHHHHRKLLAGKGVRINPDADLHEDAQYGGRLVHLSAANANKARRSLKNGKPWNLKLTADEQERTKVGAGVVADVVKAHSGTEEELREALKEMIALLPEQMRQHYDDPIWHEGERFPGNPFDLFVKGAPRQYEPWAQALRDEGLEPSETAYRLQRLEAWSEHKKRQDNRYSGFTGFLRGAFEAIVYQAPLSLCQVANTLGKIIPGAQKVTDKIEEKLNPDGKPLPVEELGGIGEKAWNLAVKAGEKASGGALAVPSADDDSQVGGGIIGDAWKKVQVLWNGDYGKCPKAFAEWLKKNGQEQIHSIVLVRTPIHSAIEKALNAISAGRFARNKKKLQYDQLFHLGMVLNGKWLLEKNHVVHAVSAPKHFSANSQQLPLDGKGVVINHLIADGWRAQTEVSGDKDAYWTYSASRSNCQSFVHYSLAGSGLDTAASRAFVLQDAKQLLAGVYGSELPTDVAAVFTSVTGLGGSLEATGGALPINTRDRDDARERQRVYEAFKTSVALKNKQDEKDIVDAIVPLSSGPLTGQEQETLKQLCAESYKYRLHKSGSGCGNPYRGMTAERLFDKLRAVIEKKRANPRRRRAVGGALAEDDEVAEAVRDLWLQWKEETHPDPHERSYRVLGKAWEQCFSEESYDRFQHEYGLESKWADEIRSDFADSQRQFESGMNEGIDSWCFEFGIGKSH